jgi:hypothetical protein
LASRRDLAHTGADSAVCPGGDLGEFLPERRDVEGSSDGSERGKGEDEYG